MFVFLSLLSLLHLVAGHASIWHPSMWGYNVTDHTFDFDNRPVVPLMGLSFKQWWFHGHLDHPPHPNDVFELPAGQNANAEIACNKGATSFYASSEGGDVRDGNDVCPGAPPSEYHTKGINDLKGCALAIAYKSDVSQVKPEDFTVFSVNQTCVWYRNTTFGVPKNMPACPDGMCTCAFFWIHSADSGSEQMYMNGFQCNVTGSTSNVALATPKVARRCGADPANKKTDTVPGNCTYGAKQPLYWFQAERNNMFEGTYSPPFYNDLYNFKDGAQDDIFQDSYSSIPVPGPHQAALPVLNNLGVNVNPVGSGEKSATSAAPFQTTPPNMTSPSATPSATSSAAPSSPTGSKPKSCSRKRSANASARRRDVAERRSPFTHKLVGMARRSRTLDPERRSDLWKPL